MFTGIVEHTGTVKRVVKGAAGVTFTVECPGLAGTLAAGDSVSVNGVCQTVEAPSGAAFTFTAVGETLKSTTLGSILHGRLVNLERAATLTSALGGHLVQGHVDGVGTVQSFVRRNQDWILSVRVTSGIAKMVVPKGSIAIDGMSLTVVAVEHRSVVTATIIPFTREHTIVGHYRAGTKVNIEVDIIGKYVLAYMDRSADTTTP
jgi:riboflavin synthase alpha subunit